MAELLTVADTLRNFRELVKWYGLTEHDVLPVDDLFYAMTPQPTLEKTIKDSILSENEMADTASDTLYDIRRKIHAAENSIRDKLDAITKSQSASRYLQDAVVSLRNGRFVVPVKAEHRGEVGGVIHDVSSSGSTLFVEPTAVVEAMPRSCSCAIWNRLRRTHFGSIFLLRLRHWSRCLRLATERCWSWMCCWPRPDWRWTKRP